MIKNISTLLVLLLTTICYGQNITLLPNTHPKAKELRHNLNSTMDSLVLECDSKILKVEIFNADYEQVFIVDANRTKIPLKNIPVGNFVVEAKLAQKILVMNLTKHNDSNTRSSSNTEIIAEGKGMMLDDDLNVIKTSPNKSIAFLLTHGSGENNSTNNQKYFWTIAQINNDSGSSKTMRLVDQKSVEIMILRHKLEINSDSGKLNKLTVWEVYKTSEFMQNQVSNPEFVYSLATDLFNPTPYYSTTNSLQSL